MSYAQFVLAHRRFLGFGLLAAALSGFGQTFFISLFGGRIREVFELSHGEFGALYSTATLASAVSLLWAGRQMDRLDLRTFAAAVAAALAVGCGLMATASTLLLVGVAMFVLRISGQGLMTHMAMTGMGRYFADGRGKAVSIASLGLPLAEAIMPPLATALKEAIGWRATWGLGAGLVAVAALPSLQALLVGHGARRRTLDAGPEAGASGHGEPLRRDWTRGEVLRDPRFYLLLPAVLAGPFIVTALFFHQVHLADAKGWELQWLASAFVAFALTHVIGLLATGVLVDRTGARGLLPWFLLPLAVGLSVLVGFDARWAAWPYLGLIGLSMGATSTVLGALWPELYGVAHLGAIRSVMHAAMVLSTALSPVAVGALFDRGVTVETVALLFLGHVVGATVLAVLTMQLSDRSRTSGAEAQSGAPPQPRRER